MDAREHERAELLRLEDTVQQLAQDGNMSTGVRAALDRALEDVERTRPQLPTHADLQAERIPVITGDRAGVFWLSWILENDFPREDLCALLGKLSARVDGGHDKPF